MSVSKPEAVAPLKEESVDGIKLKELSRIANLTKKFKIFDWKGHGRIQEQVEKFEKQYGYRPKVILYYKDAYFIETNIPVVEEEKI